MVEVEGAVAPDAPAAAAQEQAIASGGPPTGWTLIRSVGPRLLRDILGPPVAFYAAWKLTGNVFIGVVVGTVASMLAYGYERQHGRPGLIARFVLGFVLVGAVIGIVTDSATVYLIQPTLLGAINGALWLGSVAVGRPLAGTFAREIFPLDEAIRASPDYRTVFGRISLLFSVFFIAIAAFQLVVLLLVGVGAFVAMRVLDAASILFLIVYCVRYITQHFGDQLAIPSPEGVAETDGARQTAS